MGPLGTDYWEIKPFYFEEFNKINTSLLKKLVNKLSKGSTFISQLFKNLSISPAPEIKLATSRSEVKRSTEWGSPMTIQFFCSLLLFFITRSQEHEHKPINIMKRKINCTYQVAFLRYLENWIYRWNVP